MTVLLEDYYNLHIVCTDVEHFIELLNEETILPKGVICSIHLWKSIYFANFFHNTLTLWIVFLYPSSTVIFPHLYLDFRQPCVVLVTHILFCWYLQVHSKLTVWATVYVYGPGCPWQHPTPKVQHPSSICDRKWFYVIMMNSEIGASFWT